MRKHSIYHLIQENRKLFYTGIIKNSYKIPISNSQRQENHSSTEFINPKNDKAISFKERSINILQDIFNE